MQETHAMSERVEISQLQELQRRGVITPEQYAAALATLLTGDSLSDELAQTLRQQGATDRLDEDWSQEREQYVVKGRYNSRFIPTRRSSVLSAGAFVAVGIAWAVIGSRQSSSLGGTNLALVIGGIIALAGIAAGYSWYAKARGYEQAHQAYLHRRDRLHGDSADEKLS
jgi:hypothetical protein